MSYLCVLLVGIILISIAYYSEGGFTVCAVTAQYNDELRHIEYAVEKYSQMLFRICYSILDNKHDAEDALQETFLRYMLKAPLFKDSEHEKAWLIKVATNISKNMCRFNARHAAENFDDLKSIGIRDDDRDIFELITRLPPKYKIILVLYYIEGYKANEIADIINVSPVTVRKRLQYGRMMLKKELERSDSHETKQPTE